jgi:hypothetical protein
MATRKQKKRNSAFRQLARFVFYGFVIPLALIGAGVVAYRILYWGAEEWSF